MFTGQSTVALDGKNRLMIPSRVREELAAIAGDATVVYVAKGHDRCLCLYPREIFEKTAKGRAEFLRYEEPKDRLVGRVFFGAAEKLVVDKQGRVLIPERLKRAAELDKELTLVGFYDRLELWDRSRWETYSTSGEATYDEDAREVFGARRTGDRVREKEEARQSE